MRFDDARAALTAIAADDPDASLAALFATRCVAFATAPPPDRWDGAWNFLEK